jgi:hypothetical protein
MSSRASHIDGSSRMLVRCPPIMMFWLLNGSTPVWGVFTRFFFGPRFAIRSPFHEAAGGHAKFVSATAR